MDRAGIPGVIHNDKWEDFGTNRTKALVHARKHTNNTGWSVMLDADDSFASDVEIQSLGIANILEALTANDVHCMSTIIREGGSVNNRRPNFFNNKFDWVYKGVLHEYATLGDIQPKIANLPEVIYVIGRREGGARNAGDMKKKYARDAEVLQKYLENHPNDPRTRFYLAQSWRDAGVKTKAMRHYKLRAEQKDGWSEEAYISCLNLIEMTDDIEDKLKWTWKALSINPQRLEAPCYLMSYARRNNIWRQDILATGLVPDDYQLKDHYLFSQPSIYQWNFFDELAVHLYWTGHHARSIEFGQKALEKCPDDQKHRLEANITHSKTKLNI
jgi:tetratricopeptide (TPR) repeat protein